MNVGILYPRSKAHPAMMQDFMDAIKIPVGAGQDSNGITIFSESIGYGGAENEVYEKAEKLLLLDGVDVLVAYIGEKVMDILTPLLQSTGKLMLAVHPGANYPGSWIPEPNIIHLTLQDAFLCWLTGREAAAMQHNAAAIASTFYDCGYLHIAVMVNGFTDKGGKVVFNYINRDAYDESFRVDQLEIFINDTEPLSCLLCVFDELPASLFYNKIDHSSKASSLDLFVSPMMLQPTALAGRGRGFKFSIAGNSPWQASGKEKHDDTFYKEYETKTKRKPNLFSLLGWEAGLVLQQIIDTGSPNLTDGAAIATALQKNPFKGPRGEMVLDPRTNYFLAPFVHCHMEKGTGELTIRPVDFPVDAWEEYIAQPTDGAGSGWTNTYLCY